MNCVERLTTNCLPVSPTTENMCCMSFLLPSRLHHRTITYGRASITSNFLIKLVILETAILCSACYFSKPTDVPSSRIIFILFHSPIHLLSSHTFKYCTLCVLTEFNKTHDDDDDDWPTQPPDHARLLVSRRPLDCNCRFFVGGRV